MSPSLCFFLGQIEGNNSVLTLNRPPLSVSSEILNIAGYRFIDLPDRDELRESFLELCTNLELRGTVLLSPNGINFFLAGSEDRVSDFIDF